MSEKDVKASINSSPAVLTNYLTVKEDFVPVRTTDLERIKRDVLNIPDGQGRFDNAFWCFMGLGVPVIIDSFIGKTDDFEIKTKMFFGISLMFIGIVFKIMGLRSKQERDNRILSIVDDIDDLNQTHHTSDDCRLTIPPARHWWEKLLRKLIGFHQ